MKILPLLLGKFVIKLGKYMGGRGSALPGKIALKLNPELASSFDLPKKIIMVTGTNGKTSVTKYIHEMFDNCNYKSITNDSGANMFIGITTTLIKNSNMCMHVNGDVLVLEVDELHLKRACEEIPPTDLVITNLFDDQVDRLGGPNKLSKTMANFIPKNTKLYLNGNDPYVAEISNLTKNKTIFFGIDSRYDTKQNFTKKIPCPNCSSELSYISNIYDHLGIFSCSCGFKSPKPDYIINKINGRNFKLNNHNFKSPISPIYGVFNAAAALSVCIESGLDVDKLKYILSTTEVRNGRLERFKFNGGNSFINLVKNPVGFNLTLDLINQEVKSEPYNLFIGVNNEEADGIDTSWYNSIDFSILKNNPPKNIFLDGNSSNEMSDVIKEKLCNVNVEDYPVYDLTNALLNESKIPCYFLCNFTMLKPTKSALLKSDLIH